jgi:NADPH:quinone reductase-like Zn-dependent oxidoreductase/acyl carrier protein
MLLAAASKAMAWPQAQLTDFAVQRPLVLPEPAEGHACWQVVVKPLADGRAELTLYQAAPKGTDPEGTDSDWLPIASAVGGPGQDEGVAAWCAPTPDSMAAQTIYDGFEAGGVAFGPAFRCLGETELGDGAARAWITLPAAMQDGAAYHAAHPVLIDAAFQLCWLAATQGRSDQAAPAMYLPIGADRINLRPGQHDRLLASVRITAAGAGSTITADILLETAQGERVGSIHHMRFARAEPAMLATDHGRSDLYALGWVPASDLQAHQSIRPRSTWVVFADDGGIAETIAAGIAAAGGCCHLILAGTTYAQLPDRHWTIDPINAGHYRQLFADIGLDSAAPQGDVIQGGVIHCWALDEGPGVQADAASMAEDDARGIGSVLHLVQCLATAAAGAAFPTWLITRGAQTVTGKEQASAMRPASAGVWGLAGVAAIEHPELHLRLIDLDPLDGVNADDLLNELLDRTEPRVALREHERWVPRLQPHDRVLHGLVEERKAEDRASRVELVRPGTFEGLALQPLERVALQPDEVRLRVLVAGINFRDVLTVLQMYPGAPPPLGVECAGIVTEAGGAVTTLRVGDRVFGFAPASLGGEAVVPSAFLMPIPEHMRAEDAAGIAVAYLTAYYGFHQLAQLRAGERVLVHAAAGGVGLAAVQLAQRCGAEIFATAGSPAKRDLLRNMGVTHVMDSRSVAFADQVMAATGGQGVDAVLNSLAGDFIPAGLRTLARGGRFLELGKRGIWTAEAVAEVRPDIGYYPYDLGALAQSGRVTLRPMYDAILAALADGSLRPLPVTVFPLEQVAEALRYMAQARHVGKVVVRIAADDARSSAFHAHPAATYWITGGLGALGLETAHWLTRAGARHLVLSGRRPPTETARQHIREIEQCGVTVRVFEADAADRERTEFILDKIASTMPPLRGVVHAAGSIRDAMLINQHWHDAQTVLRGKAHGAWLLHEVTQALSLDFFILYSAASVILGAPGQGLYPAANAQLDALAHFRRRSGLPALSVAWGAWSAGMAADLAESGQDVWQARGLAKINAADGFAQLERLLAGGMTYGAVIPIDWRHFLKRLPAGADRAFFSGVAPVGIAPVGIASTGPKPLGRSASDDGAAMLERLRRLAAGQRRLALSAHLTDRVRNLLGLDSAAPIEAGVPLKELGLDSLMAVELRNILVRSAGIPLPATLLFDHPTLDALATCLGRTWRLDVNDDRTTPIATAQPDTRAIAALSEAEAEALLAEELALGMIGTPA